MLKLQLHAPAVWLLSIGQQILHQFSLHSTSHSTNLGDLIVGHLNLYTYAHNNQHSAIIPEKDTTTPRLYLTSTCISLVHFDASYWINCWTVKQVEKPCAWSWSHVPMSIFFKTLQIAMSTLSEATVKDEYQR